MKTDVPLFGSRRLGILCNGVVCMIFDCELYHYREVRCWHFWHEQEDASGGPPDQIPGSCFRLDLQLGYSSMKSNGTRSLVLAEDLAHTILSGKYL